VVAVVVVARSLRLLAVVEVAAELVGLEQLAARPWVKAVFRVLLALRASRALGAVLARMERSQ
jgi:hypothetical protein